MKKLNKKGFTLAELLIVIAIIAVLIAIAIPTFSGALENARLQTDHANIRSAYAMVMSANMMGGLDTNGDGTFDLDVATATADTNYYFKKDGTLGSDGDATAYKLQANPKAPVSPATISADCTASVGCNENSNYVADDTAHAKGSYIIIKYDYTNKIFSLKLATAP